MKETNQENEKLLLSIKEASSLIGISERAMRDLSLELNIQVRIGRRVLIHKKNQKNGLTVKYKTGKNLTPILLYNEEILEILLKI